MSDWTEELRARPPGRRYPFFARRDRRRTAQALAGGRSAAEVAVINRVAVREVESLLRNPEFAALLEHYRRFEALPRAERLARLAAAALHMLELAVETGDLKVCAFVLKETRAGRDPACSLARHAEGRFYAERLRNRPLRQPPLPRPRAGEPPPRGAEPGNPWTHCAATRDDQEEAEALAVADLGKVRQVAAMGLDALAGRLLGEVERAGTAPAAAPLVEDRMRRVARHFHARPAESLQAAERLQSLRRSARQGHPPPWCPDG